MVPEDMNEELLKRLKGRIRDVPDYPKKGIVFRDITPLLKDRELFRESVLSLSGMVAKEEFDYVAGIEARGFIIGAALAYTTGKGFIPIRKKGKLPFRKVSKDYDLEYGTETLEIHSDSAEKGSRVLVVDDLLATGGTAQAAGSLIASLGARVAGYAFIIELEGLGGRARLSDGKIFSLIKY